MPQRPETNPHHNEILPLVIILIISLVILVPMMVVVMTPASASPASTTHDLPCCDYSYHPHLVFLEFRNSDNLPMIASITAIPQKQDYTWLTIFGINIDPDILNMQVNDTTNNDGTVIFPLMQTNKYRINIVNESYGLNESYFLYPYGDHYIFSLRD